MSHEVDNPTKQSWETFWASGGNFSTETFSQGGVSHPLVDVFWKDYFSKIKNQYAMPQILDIASGRGAVVDTAYSILGPDNCHITATDISKSAIKQLTEKHERVTGFVADAISLDLNLGEYQILTSQFGIEYAGIEAIINNLPLVANGGQVAFLIHSDDSIIHKECTDSIEAIEVLQTTAFLPKSIAMLEAGYRAITSGSRDIYNQNAKTLNTAITELENIMRKSGTDVAGGAIYDIYNNVADFHEKITHYDEQEIISYLNQFNDEITHYHGRMKSMVNAALSQETFSNLCDELNKLDFNILQASKLQYNPEERPVGWILIAQK